VLTDTSTLTDPAPPSVVVHQTGTGKTHTMEGSLTDTDLAGVIPRSVRNIFDSLEKSNGEYIVKVSYLEVYNEDLKDLLVPSSKELRLCEDPKAGVTCLGLEEIVVKDAGHIFEILEGAVKNRTTAATQCNERSSRSHSIFTMKIHIKESTADGEDVVKIGKLNLVDLAGSECVGKSGVQNVQVLQEKHACSEHYRLAL
jgi:kinesin family protein 11